MEPRAGPHLRAARLGLRREQLAVPSPTWTKIVVALVAAAVLAIVLITGQSIDRNGYKWISGIAGAIALILLTYDRWVWRWPLIRKVAEWTGTPVLHGTWKGTLAYEADADGKPGSTDFFMTVQQTYSDIEIHAYVSTSESHSMAGQTGAPVARAEGAVVHLPQRGTDPGPGDEPTASRRREAQPRRLAGERDPRLLLDRSEGPWRAAVLGVLEEALRIVCAGARGHVRTAWLMPDSVLRLADEIYSPFDTRETRRLRTYVSDVEELVGSAFQPGEQKLTLSAEMGGPLQSALVYPGEEVVRAVVGLYNHHEPTSYHQIIKLLSRHGHDRTSQHRDAAVAELTSLRGWEKDALQPTVGLKWQHARPVGSIAYEEELTPEVLIDLFLHGKYLHKGKKKSDKLDAWPIRARRAAGLLRSDDGALAGLLGRAQRGGGGAPGAGAAQRHGTGLGTGGT